MSSAKSGLTTTLNCLMCPFLTLANSLISPLTLIDAPVADVKVTLDFFHVNLFFRATSSLMIVTVAPLSGQEIISFPNLDISLAFIANFRGIEGVGENFLFPGPGVQNS